MDWKEASRLFCSLRSQARRETIPHSFFESAKDSFCALPMDQRMFFLLEAPMEELCWLSPACVFLLTPDEARCAFSRRDKNNGALLSHLFGQEISLSLPLGPEALAETHRLFLRRRLFSSFHSWLAQPGFAQTLGARDAQGYTPTQWAFCHLDFQAGLLFSEFSGEPFEPRQALDLLRQAHPLGHKRLDAAARFLRAKETWLESLIIFDSISSPLYSDAARNLKDSPSLRI